MNATDTITTVAASVNAFLAGAREKAKDGLTWAEFGRLLVELLYLVVAGLDAVTGLTGPEKKQIALTSVAALFDSFADRAVPLAAWPAWMLIRPATRLLVLSLAAGAVEALLRITRSQDA